MTNILTTGALLVVSTIAGVLARAAEAALRTQDSLGGTPSKQTDAQKAVVRARDGLLEGVAQLAEAMEHLEAENLAAQAALNMHSNQAADAFMRIQGAQAFSQMVAKAKADIENILNPQPAPQPEATPAEAPAETPALTESTPEVGGN